MRSVPPIWGIPLLLWALPCPSADAGPTYGGTYTYGDWDVDTVNHLVVDAEGNVIFVGNFQGTIDFDPTAGADLHIAEGIYQSTYVSKLFSDGSYGWTGHYYAQGTAYGPVILAVATDSAGNVVLGGFFAGTVDFDFGLGVDERSAVGEYDAFVSKLAPDGTHLWARSFGGLGGDYAYTVDVASSGAISVGGTFSVTVDFDPSAGMELRNSAGDLDIFISQFSTGGTFERVATVGGGSPDFLESLATDSQDNLYAIGWFGQSDGNTPPNYTIDFDPTEGTDQHTSLGESDAYVLSLDSKGDYRWTRTLGGAAPDVGYDLAINELDEIYVTGGFNGTPYSGPYDGPEVDLDPTEGVEIHVSNGQSDIYLVKLQSDGSFLWARSTGGTESEYGGDLTLGVEGQVYLMGGFGDLNLTGPSYTVDLDPSDGYDLYSSVGSRDVFISSYDDQGQYFWSHTFGGYEFDRPMGCAITSEGILYAGGWFYGSTDFDPNGSGDLRVSNGDRDIYVTWLVCPPPDTCEADVNGDGSVDPLDSGYVISRMSCSPNDDEGCAAADTNGDGVVDPLDVGFVLSRFGACG